MAPMMRVVVFILAAEALTVSCSREAENAASSAGAPKAQPEALPPETGISQTLTRSDVPAISFLDSIGSVNNPISQKSIRVAGDQELVFSGWAIDQPNSVLAGGVEIVIDQTPYVARYGLERPDVAQHLKNPGYQKSGFQLIMPPGHLPRGPHSATVRVLAQDRKLYYVGPTVQFVVE